MLANRRQEANRNDMADSEAVFAAHEIIDETSENISDTTIGAHTKAQYETGSLKYRYMQQETIDQTDLITDVLDDA